MNTSRRFRSSIREDAPDLGEEADYVRPQSLVMIGPEGPGEPRMMLS